MNVKLIKFIDKYLGGLLCLFFGISHFFSRKKFGTRKLLIIQLWGIGETILTLPAIHALRRKYPKSTISLICTERNKDVYYGNSDIDSLLTVNLGIFSLIVFILKKYRTYDLVIDFEEYLNISAIMAFFTGKYRVGYKGNIRSLLYNLSTDYNDKQHVVETHLDLMRLVGANLCVRKLIELKYPEKDRIFIEKLLKKLKVRKTIIGFGAGAAESAKSRMWPRFVELAACLLQVHPHISIILFGSSKEQSLNEEIVAKLGKQRYSSSIINLAGRISLLQAFALAKKCRLFISNDTGTMHIAAAQGVETIGLFGPNIPVRWGPFGKGNHSIYRGRICRYSPCINVHKGQIPECRFGEDNKCMKAITVEDVTKKISI